MLEENQQQPGTATLFPNNSQSLSIGTQGKASIKNIGGATIIEATPKQLQDLIQRLGTSFSDLIKQGQIKADRATTTAIELGNVSVDGKLQIEIVERQILLRIMDAKLPNFIMEWNLPPFNPNYIERPGAQALINNRLAQSNNLQVVLTACHGLGGVGKTQLAHHTILYSQQAYTFKGLFAANDLDNQYQQLAVELGLVDKDGKPNANTIRMRVRNWFESHPGWLLVYDDAQDYEKLQPYLPTKGGHLLITTRNSNWTVEGTIPIDIMTEAEALALLQKITKRQDFEMAKLAKELGYLPLALAQAAAYISQKKKTRSNILNYTVNVKHKCWLIKHYLQDVNMSLYILPGI
jgi:hypothetical protein